MNSQLLYCLTAQWFYNHKNKDSKLQTHSESEVLIKLSVKKPNSCEKKVFLLQLDDQLDCLGTDFFNDKAQHDHHLDHLQLSLSCEILTRQVAPLRQGESPQV